MQNDKLLKDLKDSLRDKNTFDNASRDYTNTFVRLGLDKDRAKLFTEHIFSSIEKYNSLEVVEKSVKELFDGEIIDGKTFFEIIQNGLDDRINIIYSQIEKFFKEIKGKVIDYGCGCGLLTQKLHDSFRLDIDGVDVRDFRAKSVTVPIKIFDGYRVSVSDKYYECAVLTNVIHHEFDNEKILTELDRIVSNKLVIIETVPEADNEEVAKRDWGRMILNDALWNRFFNYANIPVPGTYETPFTWIKRFEKYGWKCIYSQDLGFDQPTIQDRHHLMVFER